jgi:hypothetical protein
MRSEMTADSIEHIRRLYNELTELGEHAAQRIAASGSASSEPTVTVVEPKRADPLPLSVPVSKGLGSPLRLALDSWLCALRRPGRLIKTGVVFVAIMATASSIWIGARVVFDAQRVHSWMYGQTGLFVLTMFVFGRWVRVGRQARRPGTNIGMLVGDVVAAVAVGAVANLLRSAVGVLVNWNWMSVAWVAQSLILWPLNGPYSLLVLIGLPETGLSPPDGAMTVEPFMMAACVTPLFLLSPLMTGDYKIFFKNIFWTLFRLPKVLLAFAINTVPFGVFVIMARESVADGLRDGAVVPVAVVLSLAMFLQLAVLGTTLGLTLRRLADPQP